MNRAIALFLIAVTLVVSSAAASPLQGVDIPDPADPWRCGGAQIDVSRLALEGVEGRPEVACTDGSGAVLLASVSDLSTARTAFSAAMIAGGAEEQLPRPWRIQKSLSRFETRRTAATLEVAHIRIVGTGDGFTLAATGASTPTIVVWEQVPLTFRRNDDPKPVQVMLSFELRAPLPSAESERKAAIRRRETELARWVNAISIDQTQLTLLLPSEYELLVRRGRAANAANAATTQPAPAKSQHELGQLFVAALAPLPSEATMQELERTSVAWKGSAAGDVAAELLDRARTRVASTKTPEVWAQIVATSSKEQLPTLASAFLRSALSRRDRTTAIAVLRSMSEAGISLASLADDDLSALVDALAAAGMSFEPAEITALNFAPERDTTRIVTLLRRRGIDVPQINDIARPSRRPGEWQLQRGKSAPLLVIENLGLKRLHAEGAILRLESLSTLNDVAIAVAKR